MARSDRRDRVLQLKKKILGQVRQADRDNPDFDGQCSVPDIWFLRGMVKADTEAALLACEVHDKRAMDIRARVTCGTTLLMTLEGAHTVEYTQKLWRRDVKRANREFFKNLRIGLGIIYATVYYLGVANKLARVAFTPERGPLAHKERQARRAQEEADRIQAGIECDGGD